ncbi:MAG: carboxypeptidase regulatory-like domain-containing protein [Alphaproteobacteria bacterium]|nr:carboxypeptidase regulatory-like domain-containing protein [Alphaproteobacteria bacterium]
MRAWTPAVLTVALTGCATAVEIEGIATTSKDDDTPLVGATLSLRNQDFDEVDTTVTDDKGRFYLDAPRGESIHIVVSGEGMVPVALAGESGLSDTFTVPSGQIWGLPETEAASWRALFAGCPGADGDGGMVIGETRLYVVEADQADLAPIEAYGFAQLQDTLAPEDGTTEACYLDEDGVAYDPEAIATGASGRFALFGVEGGPWTLTVGRYASGGSRLGRSTIFVPEGGAVSRRPALVPL